MATKTTTPMFIERLERQIKRYEIKGMLSNDPKEKANYKRLASRDTKILFNLRKMSNSTRNAALTMTGAAANIEYR